MAKREPEELARLPLPRVKTLGDRIKATYERAGYNRSQMARLLGKSLPTLTSWELVGTGHPDAVQDVKHGDLQAIADFCGVTVEWLATGREESRVELDADRGEPPYPAWKRFVDQYGKTLSEDEYAELASLRRRIGPPSVEWYHGQLGLIRMGIPREDREAGAKETAAGKRELEDAGGRVVDRRNAKKRKPKG